MSSDSNFSLCRALSARDLLELPRCHVCRGYWQHEGGWDPPWLHPRGGAGGAGNPFPAPLARVPGQSRSTGRPERSEEDRKHLVGSGLIDDLCESTGV